MQLYKFKTQKDIENGNNIDDIGELCEEFTNYWTIFADSGYTGLEKEFHIITLAEKTVNGYLTTTGKNVKKSILYNCILVENNFGRLDTFGTFLKKWKWNERSYKYIFSLV